jgi:uncharacterized protein
MFQRRVARTPLQNLRELFWPSMGWKRSLIYVKHRLVRLADTTHKIALGFAIGASVSFSPILGTHFIQAGIIAFLARGNILSAMIGTFIGNPWTFPIMWWISITLGAHILSFFGIDASHSLPEEMDMSVLWELMKHEPLRILLPWMIGGYIMVLVSIPIYYFIFYRLIAAAKAARSKARLRRVHQVAREVTGQKD